MTLKSIHPLMIPLCGERLHNWLGPIFQVSPSAFLHGQEDFRAWLLELRHATPDAT